MNRLLLIRRVRSLTRDLTNSVFREVDIIDFINEGIDRFIQIIPELKNLIHLDSQQEEPSLIPKEYQHLLAIYASSRCFFQDEQHHQATVLMNEFETKLNKLKSDIENGQIVIKDEDGNIIESDNEMDAVHDVYFNSKNYVF